MTAPNTTPDPKVLERIRKMLNLANNAGATEHEALAAAEMAQKTMRKYNLTMAEVETTAGSSRTKQYQAGRAQYAFQQRLMQACAEVNFCVSLKRTEYRRGRPTVVGFSLIGREANVISAQGLFDYLMGTIERVAFDYVGRDNTQRLSKRAVSFKEGCADRLGERLRARHIEALAEQATEARAAKPSHGMALALRLTDIERDEADHNADFRRGVPEGTTARERQEARHAWAVQEAVAAALAMSTSLSRDVLLSIAFPVAAAEAQQLGLSEDAEPMVFRAVSAAVRERLRELEQAAELAKETPAQRAKREEQERKEDERAHKRWEREWRIENDRRDHGAYREGARTGNTVGLDKQVEDGPVRKALS